MSTEPAKQKSTPVHLQLPMSMIVLDNLERLLDYFPIGPRFCEILLSLQARKHCCASAVADVNDSAG